MTQQPFSRPGAIDLSGQHGFVGSVAGDDTILVVMENRAAARALRRHLDALAAPTASASK